ncbi:MAG: hypothetical protein R6V03_04835 [Kiritimatiellia bacterium]
MKRALKYLAVVAIFLFAICVFSDNDADVDIWGNVGFVNSLPWTESFKYLNTYSYTEPGNIWVNHEWLGQYILHLLFRHGGNPALLVAKLILGLSVVALIEASMRRRNVSGIARFFSLLLIISTMGYGFSTRPHHFTYLFLAVLFFLFRHHVRNRKLMFSVLPVMGILWANLHGAFFIGIVTALACAVFSVFQRLSHQVNRQNTAENPGITVCYGLILAGAGFVNPYGPGLWRFIGRSAAVPRRFLSEWDVFNPLVYFAEHPDFIFLALLSIVVVLAVRPRDVVWDGILLLSLSGAIMMRRNIPLFAITAGFVVPERLDGILRRYTKDRLRNPRVSTAVICGLCALSGISAVYALDAGKDNPLEIQVDREKFPVEAVSFVKANGITGNLLPFFDWAEYCIWKLYPDCRVYMDGRLISAYSAEAVDSYFDFIYRKENRRKALLAYPTDMVLIHRGNPAYRTMIKEPGWSLVFQSSISALFLKRSEHEHFFRLFGSGACVYPPEKSDVYFP